MASRKRIIRLQRKVLQAAALGSVKLLRTILHSHARPLRKEQKKSRKRRREDDRKFCPRKHNSQKKRARKADQREIRSGGKYRKRKDLKEGFNADTESDDSGLGAEVDIGYSQRARQRETWRRGSDGKRKGVGEGNNPDEESEDLNFREGLWFGHSIRARREEQSEKTASGKHEEPSSEGGQTDKDDCSSPSNARGSSGKESCDGLRSESDIEDVSPRQAGRKHALSRETVRSIVNCRDAEGLSPLHHACHAGSEDLVKYLISKGASVHVRNSKGNTPLHIAAKLGPASIVTILKDADADMEAFNDQGITPSDILGEKEAAARREEMLKDQQKWQCHLGEELSDNEDTWWGTEWGEDERPDWEDLVLERMAESRQGRGLYNEPFSLRDFLKAEKNKTQSDQGDKSNRRGRHTARRPKDDKRSPEVVIGPALKVPVSVTQSYSQRWKTFSESYNLCVSYSSVPFPVEEGKEDTLRDVLLQGINPSMQRTALRKEMLRWHPDKFLQKWGVKLQGPDHDRIVARVNGISEAIHQLYKNLPPVK